MHPLDRCIKHPPLAGSDGPTTAELKIVGTVRIGDNHSAQLVTVQILRTSPPNVLPTDTNLFAKIYDPLYFNHEQDDADPFLYIDRDYARETAAYLALPQLYGTVIPNYFGSYTLQWPIDGTTTRIVRLILIELVSGTSMQQLSPVKFSQRDRQVILKAVIDAETSLYTCNVWHGDIHPRNILLRNTAKARKITIIDFGKAVLGRTPYPEEEQRYLPGVPISPLLRWNKARLGDFGMSSMPGLIGTGNLGLRMYMRIQEIRLQIT
jgi:serine/threonine protein kinase